MQIKEVHVFTREIPLKRPFVTALRRVTAVEALVVQLTLEDGTTGQGSAVPTFAITGDSLGGMKEAIEGPIKRRIFEENLTDFNQLLDAVQNACVGNCGAKAAVDMALHDLRAKRLGVPLVQLLGGNVKTELESNMTLSLSEPEEMKKHASRHISEGYRMLKVKLGDAWQRDLDRLLALQGELPEGIRLRIDANQGWSPKDAVRIIHLFEEEKLPIDFIEQPVAADDLDGLAYVTQNVGLPIMADESLATVADALTLVHKKAADLFNIKLLKCGGIREAMTIASIAEAGRVPCMIGSMMEATLSVTAAAHVAAAHPNITMTDLDAPLWLERSYPEGGMTSAYPPMVTLDERPGLGVELAIAEES
ncbi:dipeptide epimerase [Shouchella shacheensis]|uniref:dipeptide epimerase n=1 Tax=Shouchella shacheensis TaxID=1649580 RepID=UPI0009ECA542|nr:dipeptide epimerase [Shouchella shacheensis]